MTLVRSKQDTMYRTNSRSSKRTNLQKFLKGISLCILVFISINILSCGKVPIKQYYVLNYLPSAPQSRINDGPYPYTIRLKELSIEEAYNRPQIVYRQSPFELRYYFYRVWAVKPSRMITDLIHKHLVSANLVSSVIRRFDDGRNPEYELGGTIEALEEYDSEELWFAHLALRLDLTRLSDNRVIYTRRFDLRKRVYQRQPEFVIRELSAIMDFIMTQAIHDMDTKFANEIGILNKKDSKDSLHQNINPIQIQDTSIIQEIK